MSVQHSALLLVALIVGVPWAASAQDVDPLAVSADAEADDGWDEEADWDEDLDTSELETLMQTQVTSVAGFADELRTTPAAIHVVTAEDIRRGGFRSIPEVLRTIPGMVVARITASKYAVSARGFPLRFSNKLLVLLDGRAVYNDIFSGVFWDEINVLLQDIDRIEVIRGPGATIWGANAVNGVINIVTRRAQETQGGLVVVGAGDYEGEGALRYGTKIGEDSYLRGHFRYADTRRSFDMRSGGTTNDAWDMMSGRIRYEYLGIEDMIVSVLGGIYNGSIGDRFGEAILVPPFSLVRSTRNVVHGGDVMLRMESPERDREGWSLQAYYDRDKRDVGADIFRETFDFELRRTSDLNENNTLVWGLGFRHRHDDTDPSETVGFVPDSRRTDKVSAFLQNTTRLSDGRAQVSVGSKVEYNDYTGLEVQPSLRASYATSGQSAVWFSVARAVRTPSRADTDFSLRFAVLPGPTPLTLVGNDDLDSEELLAIEAGYRGVAQRISYDVAVFFNDYKHLLAQRPTASPFVTTFGTSDEAKAYGIELAGSFEACDDWTLKATYSFYKLNNHGRDPTIERETPKNRCSLFSRYEVSDNWSFDVNAFYSDNISAISVPSYVRVDAGLSWRNEDGLTVSVWGYNLTDPGHVEFEDNELKERIDIPRSVFVEVSMPF